MRARFRSESEQRGKCRIKLSKMAKRIEAGERNPAPIVQIKKMVMALSVEKGTCTYRPY